MHPLVPDPRAFLTDLFHEALASSDPYQAVLRHAGAVRGALPAGEKSALAVAFGKAACPMALALEEVLGDRLAGGIAVTKYGHADGVRPRRMVVREAGHPVPDAAGAAGTEEAVRLVGRRSPAAVFCLISGGGSALFVAPAAGITLAEKQAVTDLLLRAGADIRELNTVRKHLSRVKGGRWAKLCQPARVVSLILSDVIGDPLDAIASGPTAPDPTTFADALAVLDRYGLRTAVAPAVRAVLEQGQAGRIPETPKEGQPVFARVRNVIVGSNRLAIQAVQNGATRRGLAAAVLSGTLSGEARDVGAWLAGRAREAQKSLPAGGAVCLIAGGETTVTVRGQGQGGRSQELALAFALAVEGTEGITLLSAGTDGTDGPTDAAGAVVDGNTADRARRLGLDAAAFLANNDAYPFLRQTGDLYITGPTGTNVMDLQVMFVQAASSPSLKRSP